ncbi:hypothetical protein AAFX24_27570 [Vibrio mediterranei]|uniref:hypothetical protein n=1 Tax=Vibrio mediterranei TaxID=689 RepID=UPI0038CF00AF
MCSEKGGQTLGEWCTISTPEIWESPILQAKVAYGKLGCSAGVPIYAKVSAIEEGLPYTDWYWHDYAKANGFESEQKYLMRTKREREMEKNAEVFEQLRCVLT